MKPGCMDLIWQKIMAKIQYETSTKTPETMTAIEDRVKSAEQAIKLLQRGVDSENKKMILVAYSNLGEDDNFTWDDLDILFDDWDSLVDKGNDILGI